ncbi:hypothetical protein QTP88_015276 [Uroleucon formosanum]
MIMNWPLTQNLVEESKQTFIKNTFENLNKQQSFAFDLCQAMLESDIPLWKLNHLSFKSFLEKYTENSVPNQLTVRKNYVSTIYENTISRIRLEIGDGPIWVSLDETTDIDGRTNNEENEGALSEIESLIEKISSQVPLNNTGDIDVLHKPDSIDIPV